MNNALKKKEQLDGAHPKHTLRTLQETMFLEWTYNSNAIKGNTLTLNETMVVLEGITVGGKTLREYLEVINHRDAIGYVEEIVRKRGASFRVANKKYPSARIKSNR